MNLRDNLEHQIVRQRHHRWPVLDIRTKLDFDGRIRNALGVKHAVLIDLFIKEIFVLCKISVKLSGRCEIPFVCRRRRDRARIHQCHRGNLPALELRALAVGEIPRRVADGKRVVGRRVARAKAGTAEGSLEHRSGLHQLGGAAIFHKLHIDWHGRRIHAQRKRIRSNARIFQNVRRGADILKSAARTACDNSLLYVQSAIVHLILERKVHRAVETDKRFLLAVLQDVHQICIEFLDGVCIARMERHRDHRLDLAKVHPDAAVIVRHLPGI